MLMVSSSSSSFTMSQVQHDVFLSFRGKDTRDNFTSHLHTALCGKQIDTFIDDKLVRGDQISPALLNAIERSKISVVIFSKRYASSRWCLEELVKILECKSSYGQVVIPVFYRVDPSDVRNQTGAFGSGFAKVEERYKDELDKLQKWRVALRTAANLSGFDSNVIKPESILIADIVKDILQKLNDESTLIDNKNLIGIDSRIEYIESLLSSGFIRKIGIWGIGGIGKTTLAGAIFNKISRHFENSFFIHSIREESEKSKGLNGLRRKLFYAILGDKDANLECSFTRKRLGRKKLLIVFDDVTHLDQIESLVGDLDYLGLGSRTIITTRDKHVLENCKVDHIYKTEVLSEDAALQLFSQYAFIQDYPREDFMQLSSKVLTYVKGVPLGLKVLGSFLFKRTKEDWESTINRLKRIPHMDIQKVLKVSYDGLNDEEQNIFLDIACFFKWWNRDLIKDILNACGFDAHIAIKVLIEKSLITESFNTITMHDLLQEMGREIVRQESPDDPSKRSRLWYHEDVYSVLTKKRGTRAIRGICLNMSQVREIHVNPRAFSKMHNLRFLQVHSSNSEDVNKVHGFEFIKSDFSELRYFFWSGYSAKSLPPNFHPKKLVALDMQFSNLEQLLLDGQDLVNLKHINLSYSNNLLRILDLSRTPNLESLILEGCTSLNESFSSIRILNKLVTLNLKGCISFSSLPRGIHWKFLRELILSNCPNLNKVSYIPCTVEQLYLDGTTIKELSSIEHPSRLVTLSLQSCSRLKCLSNDISKLGSLEYLNLCGCSKLKMIPKISSKMIRELYLEGTAIKELSSLEYPFGLVELNLKNCSRLESLPEDVYRLKSLANLCVSGCSKLDRLPDSLGDLKSLSSLQADEIAIREMPSSIVCLNSLIRLVLSDSCINELPNNIGQLASLRYLSLCGNSFKSLPQSIKDLSNLIYLSLRNCKRLQSLPELPQELASIVAEGCLSLEALSGLPNLCLSMRNFNEKISFMNCLKLDFNALPVMTDALQHIQQNADVWFRSKENYLQVPCGFIYFPGSEIPEWFSFKSKSPVIELPAGWLNDNLVGFALCFVLSTPNNHMSQRLHIKFHLSIDGVMISNVDSWAWTFDDELESDHIFLGYDYQIMNTSELHTFSLNSEGSIQFHLVDHAGKTIEYERIKKCGVRLLYTKDYLRKDADADERMKRGKRKRLKTMNGGYVKSCGGCLKGCQDCCGTNDSKRITFPHPEVHMRMKRGLF